jgi:ABC-type transporter Mla maintaining outer membrane lipid asymmetry ATPase subunit MlaF
VIAPVLDLADVSMSYGGLRPLRIQRLTVSACEHVALIGLDQPMAEVFVNLVTGATLPERGQVTVFGQSTAAIVDGADWLALVDRFGIVSERAVLLDALTVLQNLAVPFTLDIEPLPARVRLARGLALDPEVMLLEHVSASVDRDQIGPLGERIRLVAARRGAAVLAMTADRAFASAVASRVLILEPATGRLAPRRGSWWFGC